jgi:hypothetical protein
VLYPRKVCVCLLIPLIAARQRLGKHVPAAMNIYAVEEMLDAVSSKRSVLYPSKVCACLLISLIAARQRLGKHVPAAMNINAVEEMLDAVSSKRSVSYQRKVGDYSISSQNF